jgi:site-specific DNA recombinase
MTFRALIFAAVSTAPQASEDKASLDTQLEQCRAVCAARGWPVVAEVVVPGHSRAYNWLHELIRDSTDYGEFIRLIEAESGDLVVCAAYDRLWRTDALRGQVMALCREHGVQVFSVAQPVEPVARELLADSDTARLSEVLFGFISEQESRTRARRVRVGLEQGRVLRRGLHHASNPPYGYIRGPTPDAPMQPVEPAASHVRWMFTRRAEGWSTPSIAADLNARGVRSPSGRAWRAPNVNRILRYETYAGVAHWGAARNENGAHVALVDADLWARVQAVNRLRTNIHQQRRGPFLLTGLTKCGACGRACTYVYTQAGHYYLRCDLHLHDKALCSSNSWRADAVEAHVLAAVKSALSDPVAWEAARRDASGNGHDAARVAALDARLADAQARLRRWSDAFERGAITLSELLLHRQEIAGQMEAVTAERASLAEAQRALTATTAHLSEMGDLLPLLDAMPLSALRPLVRRLIARVRLSDSPREIVIDWV